MLLQAEGDIVTPLRVTVESVPCVSPKLVPVTVTVPPIGVCAGETAVMTGIQFCKNYPYPLACYSLVL